MGAFSPETLKLLQSVLDDAWESLAPRRGRGQLSRWLRRAFWKLQQRGIWTRFVFARQPIGQLKRQ